jgi:hypothetical protein
MKTVAKEFQLGKSKPSIHLPLEGTSIEPVHFKKSKPPPTFSIWARHQHPRTFESQSTVKFKNACKARISFSVDGEKCF